MVLCRGDACRERVQKTKEKRSFDGNDPMTYGFGKLPDYLNS